MIIAHFMGRIGPPGRRGTQRDVAPKVNVPGGASAATPSGGPLSPTEGRGL